MIFRRKITAGALAFVMLSGVLCSCSFTKENRDEKLIKELPEEFLEAVLDENSVKIKSLSKGYDPDELIIWNDDSEEYNEICRKIIQTADIEEVGTPKIDKKSGSAELTVTVSQLDLDAFYDENSIYMKHQSTLDALDKFHKYAETDIDLEFIYDDLRDKWFLSSESARKFHKLLSSVNVNYPVSILPDEAGTLAKTFLEDIASGKFYEGFDWEKCQVYDNTVASGTDQKTQEATERFISAYMQYDLNHAYQVETNGDYKYVLTGYAPSHDELSQVLFRDDFVTNSFINRIRFEEFLIPADKLWEYQTALVYDTLTEAVDECNPEDYKLVISINPYSELGTGQIPTHGDLIIRPDIGFYQADHGVGWDQLYRCTIAALDRLYENGEIDSASYSSRLELLTPSYYGYLPDDTVSSSGHPNQALGTHEHTPSTIEDDLSIYGYSNPDENGFWMHYAKNPLETIMIGYYVDDSGIWIVNYFLEPFNPGTNLLVEWKIDGKDAGSGRITIDDECYEIEVHLETDGFPSSPHIYEMRLWSEGRDHIYTYVTLTDTN